VLAPVGEIQGFATRFARERSRARASRRHEQHVVDVYRVIAIVAERSPVDGDARHPLVAERSLLPG
jgi:hypothetical protein